MVVTATGSARCAPTFFSQQLDFEADFGKFSFGEAAIFKTVYSTTETSARHKGDVHHSQSFAWTAPTPPNPSNPA